MSYEYAIVITEKRTVRKVIDGAWVQGAGKDGSHGYAPDREEEVKIESIIYRQQINEIDLFAIIRAVNGKRR